MSKYEITFLLNKEEDLKEVEELFGSYSAKLLQQDKWGKKTLSYPIKKQRDAYYINWKFELEPAKLKELKQKLDFNEKLLRYLLLICK